MLVNFVYLFFFFKQKTADEMRISDWSSDVCSSDLNRSQEASKRDPLLAHLDDTGVCLAVAHHSVAGNARFELLEHVDRAACLQQQELLVALEVVVVDDAAPERLTSVSQAQGSEPVERKSVV